jgi:hypothetical protein
MRTLLVSLALLTGIVMGAGGYTGLGQGFYLPSLSLVEDNGYGQYTLLGGFSHDSSLVA